MGTVDNRWVGAAVEQQRDASNGIVLCGEMHGDGRDAVTLAAPIVAEIRVGVVI